MKIENDFNLIVCWTCKEISDPWVVYTDNGRAIEFINKHKGCDFEIITELPKLKEMEE